LPEERPNEEVSDGESVRAALAPPDCERGDGFCLGAVRSASCVSAVEGRGETPDEKAGGRDPDSSDSLLSPAEIVDTVL
jgi:hypothetical protein